MEYLVDKLLRETVKFLEICQRQAFNHRINLTDYYNLTNVKFKFIDNVLENEKKKLFIDKELRKRLNRLFINDYFLCEASKKIVGK